MAEGEDDKVNGVINGGVKVATSLVDAFKKEPWSLALVVMNLALLVALFYILVSVKEQRAKDVAAIYENQRHIMQLIASCNRSGSSDYRLQSDESHPVQLPPEN